MPRSDVSLQETLYVVLDTNVLLSHLKFITELRDFPIQGGYMQSLDLSCSCYSWFSCGHTHTVILKLLLCHVQVLADPC